MSLWNGSLKMAPDGPLLSAEEQISRLRQRGMVIDDEAYARRCLSNVSYSRLKGYWIPSEDRASGKASKFSSDSRFEDVFDLYIFDRTLRLIVMDAIEWVEVALRTKWIDHMGINYGEFGYMDRERYKGDMDMEEAEMSYNELKKSLISVFKRSPDADAISYRKNKLNRREPPIWMAAEAMNLGLLIKFINGLKRRDRAAIAKQFDLAESMLISMIRNIHRARNICCHHGRLWSRNMSVLAEVPRHPESLGVAMSMTTDSRRLHNTLVILDYFLSVTFPEFGKEWRRGLFDHLRSCPLPYPKALGFPAEWEEWAPWHDS